ncbi:hypothetical protein GCM10011428_24740 [Streptomyces violaceus]
MRWIHAAGRGLLVLVVVLTGYVAAGAQAGEPPEGGRGPLTLATAGDLTGYLGPLLEGWNRTHPGEKVTLVELPDSADETQAQMATDLRDGDRSRFDVLNIDVNWTSEFAAAGWIRPLPRDRFPLKTFLPPVVDTATYDGQLYAVPYVTNAGLLLYRKDVLAKEGVAPPRTWAELERYAKTIARSTASTATPGSSSPTRASPSTRPRPSTRRGARSSATRASASPSTRRRPARASGSWPAG